MVCFDSLLVAALGFFAGVISVFAHLAWDVGIACLHAGGATLSILAATDED